MASFGKQVAQLFVLVDGGLEMVQNLRPDPVAPDVVGNRLGQKPGDVAV